MLGCIFLISTLCWAASFLSLRYVRLHLSYLYGMLGCIFLISTVCWAASFLSLRYVGLHLSYLYGMLDCIFLISMLHLPYQFCNPNVKPHLFPWHTHFAIFLKPETGRLLPPSEYIVLYCIGFFVMFSLYDNTGKACIVRCTVCILFCTTYKSF